MKQGDRKGWINEVIWGLFLREKQEMCSTNGAISTVTYSTISQRLKTRKREDIKLSNRRKTTIKGISLKAHDELSLLWPLLLIPGLLHHFHPSQKHINTWHTFLISFYRNSFSFCSPLCSLSCDAPLSVSLSFTALIIVWTCWAEQ